MNVMNKMQVSAEGYVMSSRNLYLKHMTFEEVKKIEYSSVYFALFQIGGKVVNED